MALPLNAPFVKYAADILADTSFGLSGGKIASECAAYAVEWGADIPHATYPFGADVPNKRAALNQNLLTFSEPQPGDRQRRRLRPGHHRGHREALMPRLRAGSR